MNSTNRAAAHIGRIGALAVALGMGAAMAGGAGVAWADPSDSGSSGSSRGSAQAGADGSASAGGSSRAPSPGLRGSRAPVADEVSTPAPDAVTPEVIPPEVITPEAVAPEAVPADIPAPSPREASAPTRNVTEEPTASIGVDPSAAGNRDNVAVNNDTPHSAPAPAAAVPVSAPVADATPAAAPQPAAAVDPQPTAAEPAATTQTVVVAPVVTAPVATAAVADEPQAQTVSQTAAGQNSTASTGLAARLLSAIGLGPLAGNTVPRMPVDSPALWALLAWTRREPARTRTASATAALPSATVATAQVTNPSTLASTPIGWVTGQSNSRWTQTNNTRWANVYGTDLGIMWFNGDNQLTQLAFGDTFSGANMTGDWRSNILLLSNDRQLNDGLSLLNTGPAYQFIPAAPGQVFFIGSEVTNIPTSAVYANGTNYVNYMSVKSWDTPGRWTTNYSAISQYNPVTDKWVLQKSTVRPAGYFRSSTMYQPGDQNFQQMAYVLEPESKVTGDTRYVYAFGTPAGRAGSAYLSRVPEDAVTDLKQYQYWNGSQWVSNAAYATPVIGDSTKSTGLLGPLRDWANDPNVLGGRLAGLVGAKTGGNVSEMSIQYNEYLDKYVVLYGNGSNNVILRTADTPEGPWSDPVTIATSAQYPGLYAPMIHPLSGTGMLTDGTNPDVSNLYWNMSLWGDYNVVLMKTDLSSLKVTTV